MLYLMMVPSGNNAALALAKYVDQLYAEGKLDGSRVHGGQRRGRLLHRRSEAASGEESSSAAQTAGDEGYVAPAYGEEGFDGSDYTGRSYFVQLMNEKAAELGCTNTHFTNPHGLHNENHYSTARDMITITKYAMSLPHFHGNHRHHGLELHPCGG